MTKVWLIGDSIRMIGYQDYVFKNIGEEYELFAPKDNCRFAKYTLWELEYYLRDFANPDIIHWNNGIWDIAKHNEEDGCFTALSEYIRDMERIHREFKKTKAKIIFATTTPCNPQKSNMDIEDIKRYNEKVIPILEAEGVFINNLYSAVLPHMNTYIKDDGVHLTKTGAEACGKMVIESIKRMSF